VNVPPAAFAELFELNVGLAPVQFKLVQQELEPSATLDPRESLHVNVRVAASAGA